MDYKIIAFKTRQSNYSGRSYTYTIAQPEAVDPLRQIYTCASMGSKVLLTFLCDGLSYISSINRIEHNFTDTITIGDSVYINDRPAIVTSIYYVNGSIPQLYIETDAGATLANNIQTTAQRETLARTFRERDEVTRLAENARQEAVRVAEAQQAARRRTEAPAPTAPVATNRPGARPATDSLRGIEDAILAANPRAIRLVGLMKNRQDESLGEFLEAFFEEYNNEADTVYVDASQRATDRVQTPAGKRRSLGDIFMICRYYFPSCTLRQVLAVLCIELNGVFDRGFRSSYCNKILKRVWYYDPKKQNEVCDKTKNDEFGNPHRFYMQALGATVSA